MAYAPSSSSAAGPVAAALSRSSVAYKSAAAPSNAPHGTFLPGTKVQVGSQRVVIEKYLSEGGFAHVYVVRVPRENHKHELAVLKRVAVPDRDHLANMRTEVETMKKVQGHKHVVKYMDSHASQLKGGGYEVFLLMEYCSGGGLIDFMNTRLQHRLTEPEILKIFADVAEGVACMHYLKPPLLHRDLKVENVLIAKSMTSGAPVYKVCDFGSAAPPRPAAKTTAEAQLIEEDVQKHTTMQYRSPEMIDVWRKQPIDEKSDIWALGVFLYKLCYYTTPFENVGQMAILNASFKYPSYPAFSDRLKALIGRMLKEHPKQRPNIYEVVKDISAMCGTEVPIKDIYAQRTHSEARRNESLPSPELPMAVGLQKQTPAVQVQSIPDIAPMRRGRPSAPAQQTPLASNKPTPSPARGDPFAALDSKNYDVRVGAVEELSKKFPSLDEFSITLDKGGAFALPSNSPSVTADAAAPTRPIDLNERVTNALADQVFKTSQPTAEIPKSYTTSQLEHHNASPAKSSMAKIKVQELPKASPALRQLASAGAPVVYKSTGTGASPPSSAAKTQFSEISNRPIWKVPDHHRSSSQPRASETANAAASSLQPPLASTHRPAVLDLHRSKSQTATLSSSNALSPTSSRPSLEGHRPSQIDTGESHTRARSAQPRQRPSSAYVSSNIDYLRDQEQTRKNSSMEGRKHSVEALHDRDDAVDDTNIVDDMDYLRRSEDAERRVSHRHSLHRKHGSRHSHSLSGATHVLTGKFGDAFKRFEHSSDDEKPINPVSGAHHLRYSRDDEQPILLSPIPGSEPTRSVVSDADSAIDETEDLPPDMRREIERRRLSQEERRVASAAAEYRSRVNEQGVGGTSAIPTKASTIQNRVRSLLDEASSSSIPKQRTAEGYGRYTDVSERDTSEPQNVGIGLNVSKPAPPPLARKPVAPLDSPFNPYARTRQLPPESPARSLPILPASAPPTQSATAQSRVISRPSVPPKAAALRTGGSMKQQWPPQQPEPFPSPSAKASSGLAALLAKDLEGVPDYPPPGSSGDGSLNSGTANGSAERIDDFETRYPSLSGIEMVETEIGGQKRIMKVREV